MSDLGLWSAIELEQFDWCFQVQNSGSKLTLLKMLKTHEVVVFGKFTVENAYNIYAYRMLLHTCCTKSRLEISNLLPKFGAYMLLYGYMLHICCCAYMHIVNAYHKGLTVSPMQHICMYVNVNGDEMKMWLGLRISNIFAQGRGWFWSISAVISSSASDVDFGTIEQQSHQLVLPTVRLERYFQNIMQKRRKPNTINEECEHTN